MVITVQGYNKKKNKATMTAAMIAGMMAMKKNGLKTLVIQLINKDIDSIERMLVNMGNNAAVIGNGSYTMTEDGIDSLLREVSAQKLMKADFDNYCTPILKAENRLDVATITGNIAFEKQIIRRLDEIKRLILNAMDVYECIVLLCPTGNDEVTEALNTMQTTRTRIEGDKKITEEVRLADKSVYCMHQGFYSEGKIYGNQIYFVITNYESNSRFNGNDMAKHFIKDKKKQYIYKIEHNVSAADASIAGRLAGFIRTNHDLEADDINYAWARDVKHLTDVLAGQKDDDEDAEGWEDNMVKTPRKKGKKLNPLSDLIKEPAKEDESDEELDENEEYEDIEPDEAEDVELEEIVEEDDSKDVEVEDLNPKKKEEKKQAEETSKKNKKEKKPKEKKQRKGLFSFLSEKRRKTEIADDLEEPEEEFEAIEEITEEEKERDQIDENVLASVEEVERSAMEAIRKEKESGEDSEWEDEVESEEYAESEDLDDAPPEPEDIPEDAYDEEPDEESVEDEDLEAETKEPEASEEDEVEKLLAEEDEPEEEASEESNDAEDTDDYNGPINPITVRGRRYPSIEKACEILKAKDGSKLDPVVVSRRLKADWGVERAFELV